MQKTPLLGSLANCIGIAYIKYLVTPKGSSKKVSLLNYFFAVSLFFYTNPNHLSYLCELHFSLICTSLGSQYAKHTDF